MIAYLGFTFYQFKTVSQQEVCKDFDVNIVDSSNLGFVDKQEIIATIKKSELNPIGKKMGDINTLDIKNKILNNRLINSVEVFAAQDKKIVANITQRKPMLRVINNAGNSYYIDNNREKMPTSVNFVVDVPLVTGNVKEEFAKNSLYDFAVYLHKNPNWDSFIEQIVVNNNSAVELIPRVGNFTLILGSLDDFEKKLDKLDVFMTKGLKKVGWDRYSIINLSYNDQVVCTKKDTTATLYN